MKFTLYKQQGNAVAVIAVIIVIGIIGALGYVLWNNSKQAKNNSQNTAESSTTNQSTTPTESATFEVNGYKLTYPLNENNKKVIVTTEPDNRDVASLSYTTVRNYYADKNVDIDCKKWVAGIIIIGNKSQMITSSILFNGFESDTEREHIFQKALRTNTIVQIGSNNVYISGPAKQNEACTDIYENSNPTLQAVLSENESIKLNWFKSLELVN